MIILRAWSVCVDSGCAVQASVSSKCECVLAVPVSLRSRLSSEADDFLRRQIIKEQQEKI